jgi:hypothetical protein
MSSISLGLELVTNVSFNKLELINAKNNNIIIDVALSMEERSLCKFFFSVFD